MWVAPSGLAARVREALGLGPGENFTGAVADAVVGVGYSVYGNGTMSWVGVMIANLSDVRRRRRRRAGEKTAAGSRERLRL